MVKSEETSTFKYLVLEIYQQKQSMIISLDELIKSIHLIHAKNDYNSNTVLSNDELKSYGSSVGKLNWLAI